MSVTVCVLINAGGGSVYLPTRVISIDHWSLWWVRYTDTNYWDQHNFQGKLSLSPVFGR